MQIGNRNIAKYNPPYIIAEIGVNHDGSVDRALQLVHAASVAGADAVKLQLFETDRLMSRAAKLASYQSAAGETDPLAMLRRLELSINEMDPIVALARQLNLDAIVTVFSLELVEQAEQLPFAAYKSASPDIINRPLLRAMASTGKPLILSTGASTLAEVQRAIGWLPDTQDQFAVLQCVSSYPTPMDQAALQGIAAIAEIFKGPVGYSDHTAELDTGALAVQAGALLLEKHLTYDCSASGPDHAASLDPDDFKRYVEKAKSATPATTPPCPEKTVLDIEQDVRNVSRQSITTAHPLKEGHVITRYDLTIKRPGVGLEPYRLDEVVGRKLARTIDADTPLTQADLYP